MKILIYLYHRCLWGFFRNQTPDEAPHPIQEFLFGFEEEGYVYYPIWHRDYFFFIVGFTLLLLLLVVIVLVLNYRARKRLALQHTQLRQANEQITASIHYASRIQQALLPNPEEIKRLLSDFGLFFKPRDIVSGDFYGVFKVEDKVLVLAMDCTGHGVPGAFLTLLAYQELRKVVFEKKKRLPSDILFELHQEFSMVLKNENSDQMDGAEMALCMIDAGKKSLTYCGARMDLMHIRNNQVAKIKAQKTWVGQTQNLEKGKNPFQDVEVDCAEDDKFYLVSDGYADQFGGPENKKLMSSQLVKWLEDNSKLPPGEMVALLQKRFMEWKGTQPQIDDVLVLGFQP